jgi:hypothetical protein
MQIMVKVFVTLRHHLKPEWAQASEFQVAWTDLPGASKRVRDLIAYLGMPEKEIGQVILNGHIKWDRDIVLHPGDRVIVQPYIGGG